jgi:hypothetical protein
LRGGLRCRELRVLLRCHLAGRGALCCTGRSLRRAHLAHGLGELLRLHALLLLLQLLLRGLGLGLLLLLLRLRLLLLLLRRLLLLLLLLLRRMLRLMLDLLLLMVLLLLLVLHLVLLLLMVLLLLLMLLLVLMLLMLLLLLLLLMVLLLLLLLLVVLLHHLVLLWRHRLVHGRVHLKALHATSHHVVIRSKALRSDRGWEDLTIRRTSKLLLVGGHLTIGTHVLHAGIGHHTACSHHLSVGAGEASLGIHAGKLLVIHDLLALLARLLTRGIEVGCGIAEAVARVVHGDSASRGVGCVVVGRVKLRREGYAEVGIAYQLSNRTSPCLQRSAQERGWFGWRGGDVEEGRRDSM